MFTLIYCVKLCIGRCLMALCFGLRPGNFLEQSEYIYSHYTVTFPQSSCEILSMLFV